MLLLHTDCLTYSTEARGWQRELQAQRDHLSGDAVQVPGLLWGHARRSCEARCDPAQANTETENWCGVLQEVAIPGTGADPADFMEAAVKFANERCWGSLSCSMMACPGPLDPEFRPALSSERAPRTCSARPLLHPR